MIFVKVGCFCSSEVVEVVMVSAAALCRQGLGCCYSSQHSRRALLLGSSKNGFRDLNKRGKAKTRRKVKKRGRKREEKMESEESLGE